MSILATQQEKDLTRIQVIELYDQLRAPLLGYLISIDLMPQEADDIIQDTFLQLHRFLGSNGKLKNPRSWVFSVAHNLATNLRKRERRLISANGELEPSIDRENGATNPSPEDIFLHNERFRCLEVALSQLTEHQQACLQLRAEGLRYREIAEVLGMKVSAVSETLKRAVLRLMREL